MPKIPQRVGLFKIFFMENQTFIPAPDNHMVKSILVMCFCCLPFGIVSLIHATKVESLWTSGQAELARKEAAEADKWANYGLIGGLVVGVLYFIFIMFCAIVANL